MLEGYNMDGSGIRGEPSMLQIDIMDGSMSTG